MALVDLDHLGHPRPDLAVVTLDRPDRLSAPSPESALQVENRNQIPATQDPDLAAVVAAHGPRRTPRSGPTS